MTSQEIAERASAVPALASTPALTITAEDIALPRLYVGQFMSKAVQDGGARMGEIYSATGQDDPDPQILWSPWKSKKPQVWDGSDPGVLFHVIGLRKGKSFSDGGELELYDYDDPEAPAKAWTTYNYTLALPEVDTDVPFKFLLTRTGRQTALNINTVLVRNAPAGPSWINAYRLTTSERENQKGKFAVARVANVEAVAENVAAAESLAVLMSSAAVEHGSTGEQPAI